MLGSSRTYNTPVNFEPICVASRMRWLSPPDRVWLTQVVITLRERAVTLVEMADGAHFYYRQAFAPSTFSGLSVRVKGSGGGQLTLAPSGDGERCTEETITLDGGQWVAGLRRFDEGSLAREEAGEALDALGAHDLARLGVEGGDEGPHEGPDARGEVDRTVGHHGRAARQRGRFS